MAPSCPLYEFYGVAFPYFSLLNVILPWAIPPSPGMIVEKRFTSTLQERTCFIVCGCCFFFFFFFWPLIFTSWITPHGRWCYKSKYALIMYTSRCPCTLNPKSLCAVTIHQCHRHLNPDLLSGTVEIYTPPLFFFFLLCPLLVYFLQVRCFIQLGFTCNIWGGPACMWKGQFTMMCKNSPTYPWVCSGLNIDRMARIKGT